MKNLIFILFMLLSLGIEAQQTSTGIVTRVIDGDTYIIDVDSYKGNENTLRVRAANFDAPEAYFVAKKRAAQPYSDEATKVAKSLLEGKKVSITYYGKDNFGRVIGLIRTDLGERLDDIMIGEGHAWSFTGYQTKKDSKRGRELMGKARAFKQGLWFCPDPVEPKDWRKGLR